MARTTQGLTSSDYIVIGEVAVKANHDQLEAIIKYFILKLKERNETGGGA